MQYDRVETEVLVIGGGAAGMRAGLQAAEQGGSVVLLSKGPVTRSGITPMAGEGLQASFGEGDSPEVHAADTLKAGRGLGDGPLVRALTGDAQDEVYRLIEIGHKFRKKEDGTFVQSLRPGHTVARNCYSVGGGWGLMKALLLKSADYPKFKIIQDALAVKLLQQDGRVCGAVYVNLKDGTVGIVEARAVILASGGYEHLWRVNDCPPDATGEGAVMALDVGATLIDLEMVQFYPATFVYPLAIKGGTIQYEYLLNPEVVGGRLLNGKGEEFIKGYPMRDELTFAMYKEIEEGRASPHGGVYLDLTHSKYGKEEVTNRLKTWTTVFYNNLMRVNVNMAEQMVEIAPAAHFCCGGVFINESCETGVPGLFAAGECAGNVQGANRMSGNAITETVVFGRRAGITAMEFARGAGDVKVPDADRLVREETEHISSLVATKERGLRPIQLKQQIQDAVWSACGPKRNREVIERGLESLGVLRRKVGDLVVPNTRRGCYEVQEAYEAREMLRMAECVMLCALNREESRGAHRRSDFPQTDEVAKHTSIKKSAQELVVSTIPVLA